MTEDDWDSGFGRSVAVFLNGDGIPDRTPAASASSTTPSCSASTPTTAGSTSPCRPRSTPRAGRSSLDTGASRAWRTRRRRHRRHRCVIRSTPVALARAAEGSPDVPVPHADLPPAGHARVRPVRRRPVSRTTWPTSASTQLYLVAAAEADPGLEHGYDVVDHARVDRPARRRGRPSGSVRRAARRTGSAWSSTSCPTTSGVADAGGQRLVVGRAAARAGSRPTRRCFDIDWSRGRLLLPVLGDAPDDARPADASSTASCATTTTASRSPTAPASGDPARRCTPASTTSWSPGAGATPSSTTGGSSPSSTLAGHPGRGPDGLRGHPRRSPALGRRGRSSTGCASTTPTACATRGLPRRLAAAAAAAAWLVVEKILEPGEALPESWPCAGTTGYDALRGRRRASSTRPGSRPVARWRPELPGRSRRLGRAVHDSKRAVADGMLARRGGPAGPARRRTSPDAEPALAELLACFPVYRSYLPRRARAPRRRARRGRPAPPRPDRARSTRSPARLRDPDDELADPVPADHPAR